MSGICLPCMRTHTQSSISSIGARAKRCNTIPSFAWTRYSLIVNIVASAIPTGEPGEVRVIVSAFPAEAGGGIGTFPNRSGKAKNPAEAKALAQRLSEELRADLDQFGHEVRSVNVRL